MRKRPHLKPHRVFLHRLMLTRRRRHMTRHTPRLQPTKIPLPPTHLRRTRRPLPRVRSTLPTRPMPHRRTRGRQPPPSNPRVSSLHKRASLRTQRHTPSSRTITGAQNRRAPRRRPGKPQRRGTPLSEAQAGLHTAHPHVGRCALPAARNASSSMWSRSSADATRPGRSERNPRSTSTRISNARRTHTDRGTSPRNLSTSANRSSGNLIVNANATHHTIPTGIRRY